MPGPISTFDALVLLKRPAAESFHGLTVFSTDDGVQLVLQRIPRKSSGTQPSVDLFDEVNLRVEHATGGGAFVQEVRLIARPSGIGERYARLQAASRLATLVAHNSVQEESRAAVYRLLQIAFAALAHTDRPDIVLFKSVYCFARDEGHPLKQHWWPTLPAADRQQVGELLHRPVAEQTVPAAAVQHLQQRLDEFLRGHTEIVVG